MSRGAFWIAGVIALLVGNAVAMGVLVAKAGDPTPRVLPDYYRKAVAWDETAAERRASAALGWRAEASLTATAASVVIEDRGGAAVSGATVTVTVRHRSRADHILTAVLAEASPGRYVGRLVVDRLGLHDVEIAAVRADDRFTATTVTER